LFTLFILAVYRIGVFITIPGVNRVEMNHVVTKGGSGSFLGMFNMFSGGALQQMSIFALGIMPYVTSSIVIQLLTVSCPSSTSSTRKASRAGRRINQLTRYGTILVAAVQGWFIATYVESLSKGGAEVVVHPGFGFRLLTVLTLTTGTTVIMWLGELITESGIGNGSSLIIFAGIVAAMPDAITRFLSGGGGGSVGGLTVLFMILMVVGTIAAICYFERAHRRIPVQYTKRQVGPEDVPGRAELPAAQDQRLGRHPADLRLVHPDVPHADREHVGLAVPAGGGVGAEPGGLALQPHLHDPRRVLRVLYTAVQFNPVDVADNLKKSGGFIPGIRPGKNTAQYIERVLSRITFAGALYLSVVWHDPGAAAEVHERAVQLRWHRPAHRRRCRARYRPADRVAPDHAQLRRVLGTQGPADRSPASGRDARADARRSGVRIQLKSREELRLMREGGLVAAEILEECCAAAKPGVSTWSSTSSRAGGSTSTR